MLIDSRTGVSDTSGVCTVQMPDTLVVCFTLNEQSMHGAASTAASAREQRKLPDGRSGLRVLPVPMRVDISEKERVDAARAVARERFDRFLDWLDDDQVEEYWGQVEIPYVPFYSLEEVLAVFDSSHTRTSMLPAVAGVVSWITERDVTRAPSVDAAVRDRELGRFLRPVRRAATAENAENFVFYLSYASNDRDETLDRFVDELSVEVASRTGLPRNQIAFYDRDRLDPDQAWAEQLDHAMKASSVAVALMSPAYSRSKWVAKELGALHGTGTDDPPVEWVPESPDAERLPALQRLQPFRKGQGEGLRFLARVAGGAEYHKAVFELAREIAALWSHNRARPTEIVTLDNASPNREERPYVMVTVLAERKDVMQVVRPEASNYGLRRQEWIPFPPNPKRRRE